jgi:hypothetical protein
VSQLQRKRAMSVGGFLSVPIFSFYDLQHVIFQTVPAMSGERALTEGAGEGTAPYSNSEGAPQYTSREVATQYSSLEGVPQYLSRDGASQYTSREGAPQYPSREAPQYTSGAPQHPSREGAPQYTGRSMPVPILITQPSQPPRRLLSERNIVPAAESDPLDLGTEQNAAQGQRKEERGHLPLDLGKDNGYTSSMMVYGN